MNTRRSPIIAAALALTALLVTVGADPVSACSLPSPTVTVDAPAPGAPRVLTVQGDNFFEVEGQVGADCSGDWQRIALDDVVVTVTFATPTGPVVVTIDAPVTVSSDRYTIGPLTIPIPGTATSATVEVNHSDVHPMDVTGLVPPTTTTSSSVPGPGPTVPPSAATPAQPRTGQPQLAG